MSDLQFSRYSRRAVVVLLWLAIAIVGLALVYASPSPGSKDISAPSSSPSPSVKPAATPAAKPAATPGPPDNLTFDVPDPSIAPGNKLTITTNLRDEAGKTIDEAKYSVKWLVPAAAENLIENKADGRKLTVIGLNVNSTAVVPTVSVVVMAMTTDKKAPLTDSKGDPIMKPLTIRLEAARLAAEPIPPGTDAQVDVYWTLISHSNTRASFGHNIANNYYCFAMTVGNISGFDLQLAQPGLSFKNLNSPISAVPYRIVRGTLERGQAIGARNEALNVIKALGPLLTGFSPFFHVVVHAKNFAEGINILSNPFEKGFEAVAPDTTLRQLEHLDEQALRDSVIFKNDDQVPIVVFFQKDDFDFAIPKEDRKDRAKVLEDLRNAEATVVFQGTRILYANRQRVVARPGPTPVPLAPNVRDLTPEDIQQGKSETITMSGSALQGASIQSLPPGITKSDVNVDPNGRLLTAKLSVDDSVQPRSYTFLVTTPNGNQEKTIAVKPGPLTTSSDEVAYDDGNPPKAGTDQPSVKITINGKYLQGTGLDFDQAGKNAHLKSISYVSSNDGSKLTGVISVSKDTPDGTYKLQIFDSFGRSKEISFKVVK